MSADSRLSQLEKNTQGQCARCGHVPGQGACATPEESAKATALIDAELRAAFAELDDIIRRGER